MSSVTASNSVTQPSVEESNYDLSPKNLASLTKIEEQLGALLKSIETNLGVTGQQLADFQKLEKECVSERLWTKLNLTIEHSEHEKAITALVNTISTKISPIKTLKATTVAKTDDYT
jgi:hypothetical protein